MRPALIFDRIFLVINTVRYLKVSQILYRLYYYFYKPTLNSNASLPRSVIQEWGLPNFSYRDDYVSENFEFNILNRRRRLPVVGWSGEGEQLLWTYNLHYFDYLRSDIDPQFAERIICDWIQNNRIGSVPGWDPYPCSLRIVNWIIWNLRSGRSAGPELNSLCCQIRWLSKRIEYHILGNHVLANAKALIFAGIYFVGDEADKWLKTGLDLLSKELTEQFLDDGGHYERSTMYQALLARDLVDLIYLARISGKIELQNEVKKWTDLFGKSLEWIAKMVHPDGEISFFNDATLGVAPRLEDLRKYARFLGVEYSCDNNDSKFCVAVLQHSGYVACRFNHRHKLICDVGAIGPDYQPGHAHADSLAFELSLFGSRVFVNCGISQYGSGLIRVQQRGTAYHNSVEIDGKDSSEVWSGFRVARRAYPIDFSVDVARDQHFVQISCGHTGYRRLKGTPIHQRTWDLRSERLVITDLIKGRFCSAVSRFHLHPEVHIEKEETTSVVLKLGANRITFLVNFGRLEIEPSVYHPGFNVTQKTRCLAVHFSEENQVQVSIIWSD